MTTAHCPICHGPCSERVAYPCGKCQIVKARAAKQWLAANTRFEAPRVAYKPATTSDLPDLATLDLSDLIK